MRVALGTATVLGLSSVRMDTPPDTAHFLIGGDCSHSCHYCGNIDSRVARIEWPEIDIGTVISSEGLGKFKRACLQLTSSGLDEALSFIPQLKMPVSVSLRTGRQEDVYRLFSAGAERVCLPLDACTQEVGDSIGRGDFSTTLKLIESVAGTYPGKISTHIIIGLGETERDTYKILLHMKQLSVCTGLFAFFPVKGSKLQNARPPHIGTYRRMQALNWLTVRMDDTPELHYNKLGQVTGISVGCGKIVPLPDVDSRAFQTAGCPGCNRPFFDSPASSLYNYPRPLTADEYSKALEQMRTYEGKSILKAGKLLKVTLEQRGGIILRVNITGDFFLYPEESLKSLESALVGVRAEKEKIFAAVGRGLAGAEAYGFTAESLTDAIIQALS